eukprot:CAMPEP_0170181368 /NCGR_PEP_ID=MMETSP0040_2-20121228/24975_1 /TAXON_ID=641309 /ORGANISM="Lotharella oceanica, Strain CCMP622" /LENGTH=123 /DNA_ID=CAMNT_0010426393 /DNA_START=139 /DNA_END=510 /DNA_ORIENTATION=-
MRKEKRGNGNPNLIHEKHSPNLAEQPPWRPAIEGCDAPFFVERTGRAGMVGESFSFNITLKASFDRVGWVRQVARDSPSTDRCDYTTQLLVPRWEAAGNFGADDGGHAKIPSCVDALSHSGHP